MPATAAAFRTSRARAELFRVFCLTGSKICIVSGAIRAAVENSVLDFQPVFPCSAHVRLRASHMRCVLIEASGTRFFRDGGGRLLGSGLASRPAFAPAEAKRDRGAGIHARGGLGGQSGHGCPPQGVHSWLKQHRLTPTLPLREGRNLQAAAKQISGRGHASIQDRPLPEKSSALAPDFSTLPQGEGWGAHRTSHRRPMCGNPALELFFAAFWSAAGGNKKARDCGISAGRAASGRTAGEWSHYANLA